ncbi:MAG: hypothetical protein WCM76_16780, partial [Bacteroidota bacterium]
MKRHLLISAILITLFCFNAKALNYYWVGGNGNWSDLTHWATTSGGTTYHVVVPSPSDNVYFDNLSFTGSGQVVTINQTIETCQDMDWTGALYNPTLSGPSTNKLNISGSLKFISGMNYLFNGEVGFEANTPGKTITMAGKQFNSDIYFRGNGGGWTLLDAFSVGNNTLNVHNGTLNTNGQAVNCGTINSAKSNPAARAINLGTSIVTITSGSTMACFMYNDNLTLNAGSSTIRFTGSSGGMYLSTYNGTYYNFVFNNVEFTNANGTSPIYYPYNYGIATFNVVTMNPSAQFKGNFTYDSLMLTSGKVYEFEASRTQTIQTLFSAIGSCSSPITLKSLTSGVQSIISKSGGNVTINYASLRDIAATGGAGFTANNSIDLGDNSGWTINSPTPRNLYWVGSNGNWNDMAHWSLSSGGPGGQCIPNANDNVFFDAASYSGAGQSTTINVNAVCKDMTWTGANFTPSLVGPSTNQLSIYGSLTFISAMSLTFTGITNFEATTTGKTITSAGQVFKSDVYFQGAGGGWTLQDAFSVGNNTINLHNGILNTNSKNVNTGTFNSAKSNPASRTLILGSSLVTITSGSTMACFIYNDNFTLSSGTSTLRFTGASGGMYLSTYNGTYYNFIFYNTEFTNGSGTSPIYYPYNYGIASFNVTTYAPSGQFKGNFTFDSLMLSSGKIYEFEASRTQTIQTLLSATGTCVSPITFKSLSPGSQSIISKSSGAVTIAFTSLRDMSATGGAVFTANNSTDMGNNSGWIINSPTPRTLYWVGNTGNWDEIAHWSLSSGGPGGQCIPNANDDVFFDNNSFNGAGQTCNINTNALCRNMTWTGANYTPTFAGTSTYTLNIYGSLVFISAMNLTFQGITNFEATATGKTITCAGQVFKSDVYFQGSGGGWTLLDAFSTGNNTLNLHNGTLNTNGQAVNTGTLNSAKSNPSPRTLNLGSSVVTLTSGSTMACFMYNDNLTITAGNSLFRFTGSSGGMYLSTYNGTYYNFVFNKVEFSSTTGTSPIYYPYNYGIATFSKATFLGNGQLKGNFTFDTIKFSPGKVYEIEAARTETILSQIDATGLGGFPIDIRSSTSGQQGNLSKASGCVVLDFLQLRDNNATGGASWYAGVNSFLVSN